MTPLPRSTDEQLIDLRARYDRATRMVWTLLAVNVALGIAVVLMAVAATV